MVDLPRVGHQTRRGCGLRNNRAQTIRERLRRSQRSPGLPRGQGTILRNFKFLPIQLHALHPQFVATCYQEAQQFWVLDSEAEEEIQEDWIMQLLTISEETGSPNKGINRRGKCPKGRAAKAKAGFGLKPIHPRAPLNPETLWPYQPRRRNLNPASPKALNPKSDNQAPVRFPSDRGRT